MFKTRLSFCLILLFACCTTSNTKVLDIGPFSIEVPPTWHSNVPAEQEDSLIGSIEGENLHLHFDFSTMGYANHLDDIDVSLHNIKIDSSGEYFVKTIWPKATGKGMTGIYMQSRKTSLNFQLNGNNLGKELQEQALNTFKTIKIKVKGTSTPLPFK